MFKILLATAVIGIAALAFFATSIYLQVPRQNSKNSLTNDEIKGIISTVEQSFKDAEKKILGSTPGPDDTPLVPDPDPEKCVCKGTGKIVHGDGHVTPCPYHGSDNPLPPENLKCKCDTSNTYCNCKAKYGACSCTKTTKTTSGSSCKRWRPLRSLIRR